ncbi:hypothetical protein O988_07093 [Pseudogymnoascus sp. VKM F-3808]|nr:hypothetical protein O988_07093 [Pseudogymnoascus sp. VKM F-3808]
MISTHLLGLDGRHPGDFHTTNPLSRSAGLRQKAWAACEKGVGHVVCRLACVGYNRPADGGRLCGEYDGSSGSAMPRLPQTTEAAASLSAQLAICVCVCGATAGR